MKITVTSDIPKNQPLILFAFEKEVSPCGLEKYKKLLQEALQEGFKARESTTALLHPKNSSPARQVIFSGLGDRKKFSFESLRRAGAAALRRVRSLSQKSYSVILPGLGHDDEKESCALSEGALLSDYQYDKYKTDKDSNKIKEMLLAVPTSAMTGAKKGVRMAQILSRSVCFVRDLVNEPPSTLTPSAVADNAREVSEAGKSRGVTIEVFDKKKIEEMNMGGLLGVNRGSAEPPVFIHLRYRCPNPKKTVALVGKGITFDSGGLSLKSAEHMETMKMDMAGAGSILGVFLALPLIQPPVDIHGILAVTENMPGGRAYKPGDVLKAMNGKTIEVLNTDAEGRLVLSDALSYAVGQRPDAIIDLATLTGACIIALGGLVAGAMGNDDDLFNRIRESGEESGEMFWRLPLVQDYKPRLKSSVADLRNISSVRNEAGAIIGGLFLQEFVGGKPWMHLDIAGPAWTDKELPYCVPGGTGFSVRTLIRTLLKL